MIWPTPGAVQSGLVKKGAYVLTRRGAPGVMHLQSPKARCWRGERQLATRFGIFITLKILSDPKTGIGEWIEADFIRAMREGWPLDGAYYFPALPYVSYTSMIDDDLTAWWVYLRARPTQSRANQVH